MLDMLALPAGFLLDLLLGDPPRLPHPVRWIGRSIGLLEKPLRRWLPERIGGLVLLLLVTGLTGGLAWGSLTLANYLHPVARLTVATLLVYYGLAVRSLADEARAVLEACEKEDWPEARRRLSGIVGRDTEALSPQEIYRACVETVAENTSDGVVAPLFYAALAGPVGVWVYKAINTLDSMVGYRSPRYLYFGWASARADDLANYLPARLSSLLIALAAVLLGGHGATALHISWRDGRKHTSPNAGWPEAAMAGALGVQLGGPSTYQGVLSEKPYIGDAQSPICPTTIRQACQVMQMAAGLALLLAGLVALLLSFLL